jgi:hypothetical protein
MRAKERPFARLLVGVGSIDVAGLGLSITRDAFLIKIVGWSLRCSLQLLQSWSSFVVP